MGDPVFWTGLVTLVGAAAAVASRRFHVPAVCGALVSAAALAQALGLSSRLAEVPYAADGVRLTAFMALALLCLLAGAEIQPGALAGAARSLMIGAAAQAAAVGLAVFATGRALGMPSPEAALLAAAALAASPAAIVAATTEGRARGATTQRALLLSSLSVALSLLAVSLLDARAQRSWQDVLSGLPLSLMLGCIGGLAIVVPLSRMTSRPAIVACLGAGGLLMVGLARAATEGQGHLVVMTLTAGLAMGSLCANRTLVREALRDLAFPCAIVFFALSGTALPDTPLAMITFGAVAVFAARALALGAVALVTRGARRGLSEAATLFPMMPVAPVAASGATLAMPLVAGAFVPRGDGQQGELAAILLGAAMLSVVVGTIATRRALARAGEMADLAEDPESWRASMR